MCITAGAQTFIEKRQFIMIKVEKTKSGHKVTVNGKHIEITYDSHDSVNAACSIDTLHGVPMEPFPKNLHLQIPSKDGFGTFLFQHIFLYLWFKTEFTVQGTVGHS